MKFCTECGSKLEAKVKFCSDCGTRVEVDGGKVEATPKAAVKPQPKIDSSQPIRAEVSSNVRVTPLYGNGFKPGVHCLNCGSKPSNPRSCQVCGAEQ
jgi:rRNA maturation endonuclease Nob1